MLSRGAIDIRAPASIVWELIANPASMVRYTPEVREVVLLSGGGGVGATSFRMRFSRGRNVLCESFVSVWEPERRHVATSAVWPFAVRGDYRLDPASETRGYRDAEAECTRVTWTVATGFKSPLMWILAPLLLFVPIVLLLLFDRRHREVMARLAAVAEADANATKRLPVR